MNKIEANETPTSNEPGVIDWELRVGFLIHDVSRLRRNAFDRCLKFLSVTRAQWWVLAYLSRQDGMTQSQLAAELDLSRVTMGGLLNRLEKSGLVRRENHATDRRAIRVFLAPHSQQLISRMREVNHQMNARILSGLSEQGLEDAVVSLDAMRRNLLAFLQAQHKT